MKIWLGLESRNDGWLNAPFTFFWCYCMLHQVAFILLFALDCRKTSEKNAIYYSQDYFCLYLNLKHDNLDRLDQLLIFTEKFSPLPGFEPGTSLVPSWYATNWAILAWIPFTLSILVNICFYKHKGKWQRKVLFMMLQRSGIGHDVYFDQRLGAAHSKHCQSKY